MNVNCFEFYLFIYFLSILYVITAFISSQHDVYQPIYSSLWWIFKNVLSCLIKGIRNISATSLVSSWPVCTLIWNCIATDRSAYISWPLSTTTPKPTGGINVVADVFLNWTHLTPHRQNAAGCLWFKLVIFLLWANSADANVGQLICSYSMFKCIYLWNTCICCFWRHSRI